MSADPLPDRVRTLLDGRIDSVTQLDILLLIHRNPGRPWTGRAVAAELRIGDLWAEEQLSLLCRRGLLHREAPGGAATAVAGGGTENVGYRVAPDAETADAVNELARTYQTHPVAVVAAIYARPDRTLRNFADAFRLRKDPTADPASGPESATGPPPTPGPPTRPDDEGGQRGLTHG